MSYSNSLKVLRSKMLSRATGVEQPDTTSLESFIPARGVTPAPQETTEDIIAKSADWLAEIKAASQEARKTYEVKSRKSAPLTELANAIVSKKQEASAKEAFIQRRSTERPSTYAPSTKKEDTASVPLDAEIKSVLNAIAAVESRGSGDYLAVGPVVKKGSYKGQRAYGRYQVMEGNIAPWTKQALGKSMSKEEFLEDEGAQDAVAAHQLQKSKDKFGTWEDAASVWFSGRPVKSAGNASDGYTTVPEYITKFRRNFVG